MDTQNTPIIQFNSPEEAYLYGLGQSIANLSKCYQQSVATNGYIRVDMQKEIDATHAKAMEVINRKKIEK